MKKIALKYGLMMFAGFTAFFLMMHFLNLSHQYYLRLFNGPIQIAAITFAIREFQQNSAQGGGFNYISGVAMGMFASIVGVLGFALFQIIFLSLNPEFLEHLQKASMFGDYLTPFTASLIIFMEGIAVSIISSYLITRILEIRPAKAK